MWYPARSDAAGTRADYRSGESRTRAQRFLRSLVRTAAIDDAPVAPGRHPLVIYIPSWGGARGENTILAQELASAGFIVVAGDDIDPRPPMDVTSERAIARTHDVASDKLARAAAAMRAELTTLLVCDEGPLAAVDARRIGVFGFSFGGAVAAQVARCDARVRAAANLDGWLFGDAATLGVPKPFLVIATGAPQTTGARRPPPREPPRSAAAQFDARNERLVIDGVLRHGGYYLALNGARHLSFCDAASLPSPRGRLRAGPLGGRRARRLITAYVSAFFALHLTGTSSALFGPAARPPSDHALEIIAWRDPPRTALD